MEAYTNRHKPLLILDGYEHRLVKISRDGSRKYYRCLIKGCRGRAHADVMNGTIANPMIVTLHSHAPDHAAVEIRKHRNALKEAARMSLDPPRTLIMNQRSTDSQEVVDRGPSYAADQRTINRQRAKKPNENANWLQDLLKISGALKPTNAAEVKTEHQTGMDTYSEMHVQDSNDSANQTIQLQHVPVIVNSLECRRDATTQTSDAQKSADAQIAAPPSSTFTGNERIKIENDGPIKMTMAKEAGSGGIPSEGCLTKPRSPLLAHGAKSRERCETNANGLVEPSTPLGENAENAPGQYQDVFEHEDRCETPGPSGLNSFHESLDSPHSVTFETRSHEFPPESSGATSTHRLYNAFDVGQALCSHRAASDVELRNRIHSMSQELGEMDMAALVRATGKLYEVGLNDCAHAIVGVAMRSFSLSAEVQSLKEELIELRAAISSAPQLIQQQDLRYIPNRIRRGAWYVDIQGMVHIPDLRVLVDELQEEHLFKKITHPKEIIHYVTRYVLCRVIPPYNYKVFVLRKRGNEENVMAFPNSLVIQIAGMHAEACGIQCTDTSIIDVELETRHAIKDVLSDLRRTNPRVNQRALRRNKEDRDWHHVHEDSIVSQNWQMHDNSSITEWRRIPEDGHLAVWSIPDTPQASTEVFDDSEHVDVD